MQVPHLWTVLLTRGRTKPTDLVLNASGLNPGDTAILSFDVSHRPYSSSPTSTFLDTLSVLHSADCGVTTVFSGYKIGATWVR